MRSAVAGGRHELRGAAQQQLAQANAAIEAEQEISHPSAARTLVLRPRCGPRADLSRGDRRLRPNSLAI